MVASGTLEEAAFLTRTGERRKNTRESEITHSAILFVRKRRAVSTSSHQLMEGRDEGDGVGTSFIAAPSNPLVSAPRLSAGSPGHPHPRPPRRAQVIPLPSSLLPSNVATRTRRKPRLPCGGEHVGLLWPSMLSCLMDLTWSHPTWLGKSEVHPAVRGRKHHEYFSNHCRSPSRPSQGA